MTKATLKSHILLFRPLPTIPNLHSRYILLINLITPSPTNPTVRLSKSCHEKDGRRG